MLDIRICQMTNNNSTFLTNPKNNKLKIVKYRYVLNRKRAGIECM